ncbi:polyphosphate polymerase domain-containing protein [Salinicoccus jeotgali]|uniref:Polyphosphate polymerase domain-containing protein n=1 Tax=Salinicoccus jeotgali TaxID=381634 RepID=A0ABP7ET08_9STAP
MSVEVFNRREQKYLITKKQYEKLLEKISPYMRADRLGDEGRYTVTSLYFDSVDHKIYFETKNKLPFRQKLRLRIYGQAGLEDPSFFEVKQKHSQVVNKRRTSLPLQQAYRYISMTKDGSKEEVKEMLRDSQVLREIDRFRSLYQLRPEMIVSYDRLALFAVDDPQLRITFDLNLRTRSEDLHLENGPDGVNFIDPGLVVLEVKVNNSVPLWLARILQELECEQRSASKYCTSMELLRGHELPNGINKEKVVLER